jgi:hypothetical protein
LIILKTLDLSEITVDLRYYYIRPRPISKIDDQGEPCHL